MAKAWERRPDETAQAFQAFTVYRDMGLERSNAKVAQVLGKSKTIMDRWSSRHGWVQRVLAYDAHLEEQDRKEWEAARGKMVRRQALTAHLMQQRAHERLVALDPKDLSVGQAIALMEAGVRIERLARGDSTENIQYTEALPVRQFDYHAAVGDISAEDVDDDEEPDDEPED